MSQADAKRSQSQTAAVPTGPRVQLVCTGLVGRDHGACLRTCVSQRAVDKVLRGSAAGCCFRVVVRAQPGAFPSTCRISFAKDPTCFR